MFCPVCKAEYRQGIRECSDCGVPLVERLPGEDSVSASSDSSAMEVLWSGTDPGLAGSLKDALDRADLLHSEDSVKLNFLPAFPGAVLKVMVRSGDREAAQKILQDVVDGAADEAPTTAAELARDASAVNPLTFGRRVFNRVPDNRPPLAEGDESCGGKSAHEPTPNDIVENFDPNQATCEIWTGEDSAMAAYLEDCLNGIGIGCVVKVEGAKSRVRVLPSAEKRAREIVREIVEQSPPE
jgi:hypothetical protein